MRISSMCTEGCSLTVVPSGALGDAVRAGAREDGEGPGRDPAGPLPVGPRGARGCRCQAPTTTSVTFGSTGMPGPKVVVTVALVM
ncbi:hypothetical protein KFL01_29950 [Kocuria flava]|uniref:Uncharacterized protein n=1 Tax=Kocuria flava TaxID=446860 RepID=A0ABQ0XCT3_9MICC|nr:hypothetical protein KFL01_29950 [Kocuria flava]